MHTIQRSIPGFVHERSRASAGSLGSPQGALRFAAWSSLVLYAVLWAMHPAAAASNSSALPKLPTADCGFSVADPAPWHATRLLDEAAARWARGAGLSEAVARSGYTATALSGLRFYGLDSPARTPLNASSCRILRDRSLQDLGAFRRGDELWVVFAARAVLPNSADAGAMLRLALKLVDEARQQGRRCGKRAWPRANPVQLSATLNEVARQHALDMARHHYFDHQDLGGRSPADRVRAAGYREQRVAENIAYGTLSTQEAIAGWLQSPGHCENVMEPRFQEMGIAFAADTHEPRKLYWVQLFADPK